MSSEADLRELFNAHQLYTSNKLTSAELFDAVSKHTAEMTTERTAWMRHADSLLEAELNADGMVAWPEPPYSPAASTVAAASGSGGKKGKEREQVPSLGDAQRAREVERARPKELWAERNNSVEQHRSEGSSVVGQPCVAMADDLIIEGQEKSDKTGKMVVKSLMRDFSRLYREAVMASTSENKKTSAVQTKAKPGVTPGNTLKSTPVATSDDEPMDLTSDAADSEATRPDTLCSESHKLEEYYEPVKMNAQRQESIDLALFQLVVCATLPFAFVSNPWLDKITNQLSDFTLVLEDFLKGREHLTLSFNGWSSRRVFNGVSVTGKALLKVIQQRIFAHFNPTMFSAVAGDGGPNVRLGKQLLVRISPWIINVYDPCHNINLLLKDIGTLFKETLKVVSGISNFFASSNLSTARLDAERARRGIATGMKSASETHFGSTFIQATALQRCIPAIEACVKAGTISFNTKASKKFKKYFTPGPARYNLNKVLDSVVALLEAGANGITTLKGQNTTCAEDRGLTTHRSDVIALYNKRFLSMMTESSNFIFLVGYVLHPFYFVHVNQMPPLLKCVAQSMLAILMNDQGRTASGSETQALKLVEQFKCWILGVTPFHARENQLHGDSPQQYWKPLRGTKSGANVIALVAKIVFSIMPSEICDERMASLLGWMNSARRSSIAPENLVACAQLSQWYKFGLTEGSYKPATKVRVSKAAVSSQSTLLSAPTLMDLVNEEDINPQDVDREALEEALFNQPDPYDLEETARMNATISSDPTRESHLVPFQVTTRTSTRWAITDYVKLDSSALKSLVFDDDKSSKPDASKATASEAMVADKKTWSVDEM
ncbi:uncharacterized protein BXZ73DRAFT_98797 [Epithele typhae]|uniref:uncharacterized protein n=1 Tax=Epithele typhae TaxID=378194 RepID=UPI0020078DEA|nr:uncharacterized protein BXZ73DRAFT_98797 [Epithele typhae]KAH9940354.1 hypothetical protein BXZ73DRAFT_98797 [Epithele typhae]